jgi:hypothetical protein
MRLAPSFLGIAPVSGRARPVLALLVTVAVLAGCQGEQANQPAAPATITVVTR